MAQRVYLKNEQEQLKKLLNRYQSNHVFLVTGKKSFELSGAASFIERVIGTQNVTRFSDFNLNPQLKDLERGVALFKKGNYQLILAIGGGSVLDMAKLISIFAHQKGAFQNFITGRTPLKNQYTPLIAIPTTAGTGAEATHFAVIYIDKTKYSVSHEVILPQWVYLSSEFSQMASPYLTACTGLDAFSQAVESLWSVNSTDESEQYALKAIEQIWKNLSQSVNDNSNEAKEVMQEAAFLAGKAINISKTTAPHALSYAFTSYYGIPHGHAVALTLPFFLSYNYHLTNNNCHDPRGAKSVKQRIDKLLNILGCDINNAPRVLEQFFAVMGVSIHVPSIIMDFSPQLIIDNVNTERLKNNPRAIDKKHIFEYLSQQ